MKKLVIADMDEKYVDACSEYISKRLNNKIEIHAFYNLDMLDDYIGNDEIDILIAGENIYKADWEKKNMKIIILTENREYLPTQDAYSIFKYSSMDTLIAQIKMLLDGNLQDSLTAFDGFIGVYDLYNKRQNTEFALTLAQVYSEMESTLYIDLLEFSGIKHILEDEEVGSVSDLITEYKQALKEYGDDNSKDDKKKVNISGLLKSCQRSIHRINSLDYIKSPPYVYDLRMVETKEWMDMLSLVIKAGDYKRGVIHIGNVLSDICLALERCSEVYILAPSNNYEKAVAREFIEFLVAREREDILEKLVTVKLPEYIEFNSYTMYELAANSSLGSFIRKLLSESKNDR